MHHKYVPIPARCVGRSTISLLTKTPSYYRSVCYRGRHIATDAWNPQGVAWRRCGDGPVHAQKLPAPILNSRLVHELLAQYSCGTCADRGEHIDRNSAADILKILPHVAPKLRLSSLKGAYWLACNFNRSWQKGSVERCMNEQTLNALTLRLREIILRDRWTRYFVTDLVSVLECVAVSDQGLANEISKELVVRASQEASRNSLRMAASVLEKTRAFMGPQYERWDELFGAMENEQIQSSDLVLAACLRNEVTWVKLLLSHKIIDRLGVDLTTDVDSDQLYRMLKAATVHIFDYPQYAAPALQIYEVLGGDDRSVSAQKTQHSQQVHSAELMPQGTADLQALWHSLRKNIATALDYHKRCPETASPTGYLNIARRLDRFCIRVPDQIFEVLVDYLRTESHCPCGFRKTVIRIWTNQNLARLGDYPGRRFSDVVRTLFSTDMAQFSHADLATVGWCLSALLSTLDEQGAVICSWLHALREKYMQAMQSIVKNDSNSDTDRRMAFLAIAPWTVSGPECSAQEDTPHDADVSAYDDTYNAEHADIFDDLFNVPNSTCCDALLQKVHVSQTKVATSSSTKKTSRRSVLQKEVFQVLKKFAPSLTIQEEHRTSYFYTIDFFIPEINLAFEIDGPHHFFLDLIPPASADSSSIPTKFLCNAKTLFKRLLLRRKNYTVVPISYFDVRHNAHHRLIKEEIDVAVSAYRSRCV